MENLSRKRTFIEFVMSLVVSFFVITSVSCSGPLEFELPRPAAEDSGELTFREAFDRLSNVSDRARNAAVKVINIGAVSYTHLTLLTDSLLLSLPHTLYRTHSQSSLLRQRVLDISGHL